MGYQAPLALPPPAGTAHWGEDVLFSDRLMAELARLNSAFLALAGELHALRPGMPVLGLPAHILAQLGRVTGTPAAAGLPYAIYDLRLRDERFWRIETAAASAVNDSQPPVTADRRTVRFAGQALTLAWHLAQVDPRVTRLSLGMETGIQEILASLPVGSLDAMALRLAHAASARFCTRERFWSLLAAAVRFPPGEAELERLRLLGLQLQGAESARAQLLHRRLRRSTQA